WGAFLPFAAIGALALAHYVSGIAAADARGRALHLYMAWAAAVPLLFYMSSRYRLPLVPALLIPAGAFAARAVSLVRRGEGPDPALARGLLAGVGFGLVSFLPLGRPAPSIEAD